MMNRSEILNKVRNVLQKLDDLAELWCDDGVPRRCNNDLFYECRNQLREIVNAPCKHENETVHLGMVICNDCGRERDWGAY